MDKRTPALLAAASLILLGSLAWYVRARWQQFPILDPAGPVALAERNLILVTAFLCAIVVIPVFIMLFAFAWRYSANNPRSPQRHRPELDHVDRIAEVVWWAIPSAIIFALAVIAWVSSNKLDPYRSLSAQTPLTIQVIALDWKWLFIYPAQNIATVNFLEIPIDMPVRFELTADAPMNSFWVPQLGGQIMAMPGMTTQLNLEATRAGVFNGSSANISGAGFAGMAFTVQAVPQRAFDAWVQSAENSHDPLDANAYAMLRAPSENDATTTYSPLMSDLYTHIVSGSAPSMQMH